MDLSSIFTPDVIGGLVAIVMTIVLNRFGITLPGQPKAPSDPSKPADPSKPNTDLFNGLPGLPGHPVLNLIVPLFLRKLNLPVPNGVQALPDKISDEFAVKTIKDLLAEELAPKAETK